MAVPTYMRRHSLDVEGIGADQHVLDAEPHGVRARRSTQALATHGLTSDLPMPVTPSSVRMMTMKLPCR
jgi:hypothetical protein